MNAITFKKNRVDCRSGGDYHRLFIAVFLATDDVRRYISKP